MRKTACKSILAITSIVLCFVSAGVSAYAAPEFPQGHDFSITETKDATCTEEGSTIYTCKWCGLTITEPIPALGHDYEETARTEATCTENGSVTRTCKRCGYSETETILPLGHNYEETARTEATCTEDGSVARTCKRCGYSETETITALGHDYEETARTEATCTENGSVTRICKRCGYSETETIQALGHDYKETSRTEPTADQDGCANYVCSRCESTKTDILPKIGTTDNVPSAENRQESSNSSSNDETASELQKIESISSQDTVKRPAVTLQKPAVSAVSVDSEVPEEPVASSALSSTEQPAIMTGTKAASFADVKRSVVTESQKKDEPKVQEETVPYQMAEFVRHTTSNQKNTASNDISEKTAAASENERTTSTVNTTKPMVLPTIVSRPTRKQFNGLSGALIAALLAVCGGGGTYAISFRSLFKWAKKGKLETLKHLFGGDGE